MRRICAVVLLILLCPLMIFASDSPEKVRVTKHNPTACHFDVGALIYVPFNESEKGGGVFGAVSITPVLLKKISAGFRMEGEIYAGKDILDSDDKIEKLNLGFTGTFIANYPLAKSFEVYGGFGARYIIRDFDKLTRFGQTWGLVLQGGGRGRLNDRIGVGAEADILFNIPDDTASLDILAYLSLEF